MIRLALAVIAVQGGVTFFLAPLPLALAGAGLPDGQVGLIVGVQVFVQIPAAFAAGALIDRFGGQRLIVVGSGALLAGASVLLVPGVDPAVSVLPFIFSRALQGIGIGTFSPAALSMVPRLIDRARRGLGLAVIGSAQNLTFALVPPISLAIYRNTSLYVVAAVAAISTIVGAVLTIRLPLRPATSTVEAAGPTRSATRRMGLAYRSTWTVPLAIIVLFGAHWGVLLAYLPQRAEAFGADVGLFFAANGLAILVMRIPTGWLADRTDARRLLLLGLGIGFGSVALLLPDPTTFLLVAAGIGSGTGAGLIITPVLLELSRRSSDADRGSAFALFSGAIASALTIGTIGAAPLVTVAGFDGAILAGLVGVALAFALAAVDPSLRRSRPRVAGTGAAEG